MKNAKMLLVLFLLLFTMRSVSAQEVAAPNISGMSVRGATVDLKQFRGDKNVLVLFYRMHT